MRFLTFFETLPSNLLYFAAHNPMTVILCATLAAGSAWVSLVASYQARVRRQDAARNAERAQAGQFPGGMA